MDEIVDIVDEDDNVLGQKLKSECHKNGSLHRGANIFVFKDDSFSELLLQKRSKDIGTKPSQLCTPGGHLKAHDSYLQGAKREFFEELFNSEVTEDIPFQELFKVRKNVDDDYEYVTVFRAICAGPFTPDHEVESYFFENIHSVLTHIDEEPERYTDTTILLLREYEIQCM